MTRATRDALVGVHGVLLEAGWDRGTGGPGIAWPNFRPGDVVEVREPGRYPLRGVVVESDAHPVGDSFYLVRPIGPFPTTPGPPTRWVSGRWVFPAAAGGA